METGKQKVKVKNHLLGQKDRKKKNIFNICSESSSNDVP